MAKQHEVASESHLEGVDSLSRLLDDFMATGGADSGPEVRGGDSNEKLALICWSSPGCGSLEEDADETKAAPGVWVVNQEERREAEEEEEEENKAEEEQGSSDDEDEEVEMEEEEDEEHLVRKANPDHNREQLGKALHGHQEKEKQHQEDMDDEAAVLLALPGQPLPPPPPPLAPPPPPSGDPPPLSARAVARFSGRGARDGEIQRVAAPHPCQLEDPDVEAEDKVDEGQLEVPDCGCGSPVSCGSGSPGRPAVGGC